MSIDYTPHGFASAALPGLVGHAPMKAAWSDFCVEEIPAYEPCGTGEHLFLWIEKHGVSAEALLGHVARRLGIDRRDLGCAGLKDTQAITRQFICVPASCAAKVAELETPQIHVLRAVRHGNKLKTGHLRGNRFTIRVPEQTGENAVRAAAIATCLSRVGMPNFYGPQRFGHKGDTLTLGLQLLQGAASASEPASGSALAPSSSFASASESAPEHPVSRPDAAKRRSPSRMLRRLALSCVQSAVFNSILSARVADGLLHRVLDGDVCLVCASGGPFVSDDPVRETARLADGEVTSAGPMFGPKMRAARGEAAEREQRALAAAALQATDFTGFGKLLQGTRRANLVWPAEFCVTHQADHSLQLQFVLPAGSYATVLLREFWRTL